MEFRAKIGFGFPFFSPIHKGFFLMFKLLFSCYLSFCFSFYLSFYFLLFLQLEALHQFIHLIGLTGKLFGGCRTLFCCCGICLYYGRNLL